MNNDLISRSALVEEITRGFDGFIHEAYFRAACDAMRSKGAVIRMLNDAPTIDAVEVVRCKDCNLSAIDAYSNRRMCIKNGEIRPNGRIWFGTAVNDDHFCAYGAKMDAEVEG